MTFQTAIIENQITVTWNIKNIFTFEYGNDIFYFSTFSKSNNAFILKLKNEVETLSLSADLYDEFLYKYSVAMEASL